MLILHEKILRASILTIPGIGSQRLRQLITLCGSAGEAWKAPIDIFSKVIEYSWIQEFLKAREKIDPAKIEQRLLDEGISLVMLGEKNYPCLLTECPDAPPLLYYRGVLMPSQEGIAIVGARRATPYGKAAASYLAKKITDKSGYVVVSGLARGIDAASHKGTLEVDGVTWAFLAGGLDRIYPSENTKLAESIIKKGALISEYPPGSPPEPGCFPARNRLISGSSRGVIVVEAAQRSGALITADFALEQGREVFAVPGPIFSEQSKGTHQLLRMGATLVEDIQDILNEIPKPSWTASPMSETKESGKVDACPKKIRQTNEKHTMENKNEKENGWIEILGCMSDIPLHIDRLTFLCPLSAREIALGLLELQLAGKVIQLPGQHYVLQR